MYARIRTYMPYVQCAVFSALRLARVSAMLWFVHMMALYRKYTVLQVGFNTNLSFRQVCTQVVD